ncbi:MAG: family 16 glycoside hydrolase, partial [Verrucomicrobiia bacterium]
HPEFASIKVELKETLKGLRDGERWQSLARLTAWRNDGGNRAVKRVRDEIRVSGADALALSTKASFEDFEFEVEMKTTLESKTKISYRVGDDRVAIPKSSSIESGYSKFNHGDWNRYRVRVHGSRHQVWINNRVVSDTIKDEIGEAGSIRIDYFGEDELALSLRNARVRSL